MTTAENKRWYGYCLTVPWIEERIQGYPLINCRDDFSRRPTPGEEKVRNNESEKQQKSRDARRYWVNRHSSPPIPILIHQY